MTRVLGVAIPILKRLIPLELNVFRTLNGRGRIHPTVRRRLSIQPQDRAGAM